MQHESPETPPSDRSDRSGVSDSVRAQILATEHWSLLATRGMTWNEVFSRASMFLTVVSAAVVALALVAQATDFGPNFRAFALLVLSVVLVLGIGTFVRLVDARKEDVWCVIGMNRLRHAYLELAPDLEPFFVTSHHDDIPGVIATYMATDTRLNLARLLASTPALVGMIDAVLAGVLAGLVIEAIELRTGVSIAVGVGCGLGSAVLMLGVIPYRNLIRARREYRPRFPGEHRGGDDAPVTRYWS